MAERLVGPVMDKIINACLEYLEYQFTGQKDMKDALFRLRKFHPKIQSVLSASSQALIRDQNPDLDRWLWNLRDAIDEANDLLLEFKYLKHKEQLTQNTEKTRISENAPEILKVNECALQIDFNLKRLENAVNKLVKISAEVDTFIHLLKTTKQKHEVGKLISLQELTSFYIKNEVGHSIGELEHMNDLRQLRIKLLENVKDAKEAYNIKLSDKRNLIDLSLEWSDIVDSDWGPQQYKTRGTSRNIADPDFDERVLDNLQPHNSLKKLSIYSFMGARSAIWMNNDNLISNLQYIKLSECFEWQTFPPFGQLPFLKFLYLNKMPKVKRLDNKFHGNDKHCVFPALEVLHLKEMEALEVWFDAAAVDDCLFPCLIELHLKDCPNLQEMPTLPPELKKLKIDNIGWKSYHWLEGINNICSISIQKCSNLISLKGHQEVEKSEKFQLMVSNLVIKDPSVLLMEPLRSITSLEKLTIENNKELVSFPTETEHWFMQVSSSLHELNFKYLQCLQSLSPCLASLSSLKILCMKDIYRLQRLSDIPISLERLELSHITSLICLPSLLLFSSLSHLLLTDIPLPKLPLLPPSLCVLKLDHLKYLNCLPACLSSLSSLQFLYIRKVSYLRELPDLPSSLCDLILEDLENLDRLPSCLFSLSSLRVLSIENVPQLRKLNKPPHSLELSINKCHPELMDLYGRY